MCERAGIILLAILASTLSLDVSTAMAGSTSTASSEIKSRFNLPAEPLDKALRDFAVQANCNISYDPSIVAGLRAPAIKGEFTVNGALSLMLTGTNLRAVNVNEDTIQILEKPAATSQGANSAPNNHYPYAAGVVPVANAGPDVPAPIEASSNTETADSASADTKAHNKNELDEITVTGTHIRGAKDSPSPVQIYSRADIDATGSMTVQQFLQTLPQNFSGGASDSTVNGMSGGGQANNQVAGSAPNLRGLGNDATLVLIDGHRVAPGNTDANFVDISMIPLTAIERIEVVMDGASAIYGADAVGGVVNIILRHRFDGVETRVQYGSVDSGSKRDVQVGQTVGHGWSTGSAVLSYQYSDQTPLHAADRRFTQSVIGTDLSPSVMQHAAFATFNQEITRGIALWGDATFAHRNNNSLVNLPIFSYSERDPNIIDGYGAVFGAKFDLPRHNRFDLSANYSESDTHSQTLSPIEQSNVVNDAKTKSAIVSLDANLDGILAMLPAGPLRYATGAQFRRETFGHNNLAFASERLYLRRSMGAGYAELHIPVLGSTKGSHGDPSVELTLADRGEHYSDFGSTNNPQIGAIWKPMSSIAFRGTWGTSFKAPLLSQLNPVLTGVAANAVPDPKKGGTCNPFAQGPKGICTTTLTEVGGNPHLKAEKATTWTLGLDVKPELIEGLSAKLTYYNIVIKDQITYPTISIFDALNDEAILGPAIVQRNPLSSLVTQLMSLPTYVNYYGADTTTIGAVVDFRYQNLSIVKTSGLDFGTSYKVNALGAQIETGVDGTYILAFKNAFTPAAPSVSVLDTPYNPTDLRLRGRAIVTEHQLSLAVFVNYVDSYSDNIFTPSIHVPSWTTADASLSYEFSSSGPVLSGLSLALSVINVMGRDPPSVPGNQFGVSFDGANANALGRFYSLRIGKRL
jgi:outer membrane receptor protein involved in Fe transport